MGRGTETTKAYQHGLEATMEVLSQINTRARDIYRQMTPGARLTSGLLLAVVVVSFALLAQRSWRNGRVTLLGGRMFSADELKAAEAAFGANGLDRFQTRDGRILVPDGEKDLYLAALVDGQALPPDFDSWIDEILENDSPFSSVHQQTARARMFREKRLGLIIRNMRGVESAAVHFDEDSKGRFRADKVFTAAVAIKPFGSQTIELEQVASIRELVAAFEAGLTPRQVTVTDLNAGRSYGGEGDDWSPGKDRYFQQQQRYEQQVTQKIREILSFIHGLRVVTSIQLNPQLETHNAIIKYDNLQSGITRSETTRSVERDEDRARDGQVKEEQNSLLNQGGRDHFTSSAWPNQGQSGRRSREPSVDRAHYEKNSRLSPRACEGIRRCPQQLLPPSVGAKKTQSRPDRTVKSGHLGD